MLFGKYDKDRKRGIYLACDRYQNEVGLVQVPNVFELITMRYK